MKTATQVIETAVKNGWQTHKVGCGFTQLYRSCVDGSVKYIRVDHASGHVSAIKW